MSKLSDLKAAIAQIEKMGLHASPEQKQALVELENEQIAGKIIPQIKKTVKDVCKDIDCKLKIVIEYDGSNKELNVSAITDSATTTKQPVQEEPIQENAVKEEPKDQHKPSRVVVNKYLLKLTNSDGQEEIGKGTDILRKVVNAVGPKRVHDMGMKCAGILLVEDHIVEGKHGKHQQTINDGYYLMTNSNNITKKQQIEAISQEFDLGLKVEVIDKE